MIALVATLIVAVYILGPDLVARWILGFVVPRKNLMQTKSEEITRGIVRAIIPFILAWLLRNHGFVFLAPTTKIDFQTLFSGLYSESFFNANRCQFFLAAKLFLKFNVCLLVRLYVIVLLASLLINLLIKKYGALRQWLVLKTWCPRAIPTILATLILPSISEWHVMLSDILLPSRNLIIAVDILTKSGMLYQGILKDKLIASNGDLLTVALGSPKRFRREQYMEDRKNTPEPSLDPYWKRIPGNLFVIVASDIATLNVRYIPATVEQFGKEYRDIAAALNEISRKVANYSKSATINPA